MRRTTLLGTIAILVSVAACSGEKDAPPPPRTPEQQRAIDSTIGASAIPGSGGVRGALAAQDSAKAKQAALDSVMKSP